MILHGSAREISATDIRWVRIQTAHTRPMMML